MPTKIFAVIGAGAAGLCAAKHLVESGIEVVIYEIGTQIGGLWVYENDNGRSSAYRSLHINSEAQVSTFRDFPFPPDAPLYPDHAEMKQYFRAYAAAFRPRYGASASTAGSSRCRRTSLVRLEDGTEEKFDGVVAASGHQSDPRDPPELARRSPASIYTPTPTACRSRSPAGACW